MRSPHRMAKENDRSPQAPDPADEPATPAPRYGPYASNPEWDNPYEQLAGLDDRAVDTFLQEEPDALDAFETGEGPACAPPPAAAPRRRPRGRGPVRSAFHTLHWGAKITVGVLVLAAFLALGDRWAVLYAENKAEESLKESMNLAAAPEVDIDGFPFLTQVAARRLDTVHLTVPDVAAGRVSLAEVSATGHDVRISGEGLTGFDGADIGGVDGEVRLSFDDLGRELGASQVTFTGKGDDRVLARGTLPVAGHELALRANALIRREGDRGVTTEVTGARLDIGDLAVFRPGAGLHLTPSSLEKLADETAKAKALLSVPAIVHALGVPDSRIRAALADDRRLADLLGTPAVVDDLLAVNLVDLAAAHPDVLSRLGIDPNLLDALADLTRPQLADRLTLGFTLPELPAEGDVRLRDVRVEPDGILVRLAGTGVRFGK
ncbi:LmeA family phospholipid-binding protein [Streptomyces sp. BBFR102]|uniref:LmeA family phospholipid-binding protein n=1 Tax=Streptomyces sp. BBFR102 TaxID=3448171 RepID=UPI003F53859B